MPELSRTRAAALVAVAGWSRDLEAADAAVRTPLALSRRVGVVSVEPGSGTSTVAAGLVSLLRHRRRGAVLAVDAAAGGLSARLRPGPVDAVEGEDRAGAPEAVDEGDAAGDEALIDLARPGETWPAPVARWQDRVAPVTRLADLVVTDWGSRPWAADLTEAASTSHVVVAVARADRRSALEAAAGLALLGDLAAYAVLVLVDLDRTADRPAARLEAALRVPVVRVRHEVGLAPGLGTHGRTGDRRVTARTRRSFIELGQVVVEQAVSSARPTR